MTSVSHRFWNHNYNMSVSVSDHGTFEVNVKNAGIKIVLALGEYGGKSIPFFIIIIIINLNIVGVKLKE